jgi:anti-sigma regulatory factor (Ser/Thr protein kinase)
MNVEFTVRLPTDKSSVPLVRGLVRQALEHLGVPTTGIDETVLALTEACANVVQHAGEYEEYQVDVFIDDSICRISVTDDGEGFDPVAAAADKTAGLRERRRRPAPRRPGEATGPPAQPPAGQPQLTRAVLLAVDQSSTDRPIDHGVPAPGSHPETRRRRPRCSGAAGRRLSSSKLRRVPAFAAPRTGWPARPPDP